MRAELTPGIQHGELNALFGFAERQLHVVKRYWVWEIVWLFYSLVSVLSIGFLASGLGSLGAANGSFDLRRAQLYLLVGALLWGYLSLVFMEAAYAIAWERWEGTIEYTFMAPVRRMTHLMGICLFAIVYGLVRTFIVFHDCSHGSFLPSKRANAWLGIVLGLLVYSPFLRWRHDHAIHHATSGDLDRRGHGDINTATVDEYLSMTPRQRFGYRLYRNPLVLFGVGPFLQFILVFETSVKAL